MKRKFRGDSCGVAVVHYMVNHDGLSRSLAKSMRAMMRWMEQNQNHFDIKRGYEIVAFEEPRVLSGTKIDDACRRIKRKGSKNHENHD